MKTIMAIGGHIGDMELTCGGTLATMSLEGHKIVIVALTGGEKNMYVIDSQGHKFLFQQRQDNIGTTEKLKSDTRFAFDLKFLSEEAFPSVEIKNSKIRKTNDLLKQLEDYEAKQKKWSRIFYPNRTRNKLFDNYLTAKTEALSMEPFDKINKGLKDLSEKYGHHYQQLS